MCTATYRALSSPPRSANGVRVNGTNLSALRPSMTMGGGSDRLSETGDPDYDRGLARRFAHTGQPDHGVSNTAVTTPTGARPPTGGFRHPHARSGSWLTVTRARNLVHRRSITAQRVNSVDDVSGKTLTRY